MPLFLFLHSVKNNVLMVCNIWLDLRDGSVVKNPPAHSGDAGSIPGLGRSPGGKWQPTRVFLPGNPTDRGAWWATVRGVAKSQTWLSY